MVPISKEDKSQTESDIRRVLWANSYCLMDTSSGASISVREILTQLTRTGFEVEIVGATIFDSKSGIERISKIWNQIKSAEESVINIEDGPLLHRLIKTKSTERSEMSLEEANKLFYATVTRIERFKPDLLFFYGGSILDFLIASEARTRGIPSVAYLVNQNYQGTRWCRDVDLIVTDTKATSNFYKKSQGFIPHPIGKFIDPANIISQKHDRKRLTFVNPSLAKGAALVAQIACCLAKRRPDIQMEVVQSRGDWVSILKDVSGKMLGKETDKLDNVIVTPNTSRMDEIYSRSRVILALSLWWESGSRVLAEAMLNGVPAIVTNHGGSPEIIGEGGITVTLPELFHEKPYNKLASQSIINEIVSVIERLWDDESFYLTLVSKALAQGVNKHTLEASTRRINTAFRDLISQNQVNADRNNLLKSIHKHSLIEEEFAFGVEQENSFQWKNAPTNKNSILINKFVFFWVGEVMPMVEQFVQSIRWQYGKTAQITQITDLKTKKISGVNDVKRFDCPKEMMFARMQGYSLIEDEDDFIAFYDTDTLFLDKIRVPIKYNVDHFLITRTDDLLMNHNQAQFEFYPEFVGKNIKSIMRYIGGCIITKKPKELFSELLEIYNALPPRMHRWYGDQVALHEFGMKKPDNLAEISEENYLKSFGEFVSPTTFDNLISQKVFNIHFKGYNEKEFFSEWFEFLNEKKIKEI